MNIIDAVLAILIIGAVGLEYKRGFGRAIFDFVALLVAVRFVWVISPSVASAIQVAGDAPANEAIWFVTLFVLIGLVLLFLGKWTYEATLISLNPLDSVLGGGVGLAVAIIVGHTIVSALGVSASVNGAPPQALAESWLGMEFYSFTTFHRIEEILMALVS